MAKRSLGEGESKEERRARREEKRQKKELKKEKKGKKSKEQDTKRLVSQSSPVGSPQQVAQKAAPSHASHTKVVKSTRVRSDKDSESPYFKMKLEFEVSLLPSSLASTKIHVRDSIRNYLLYYSDALDGVMLSFDNVKILSDSHTGARGRILNELPFIHYVVSCNSMVYSPSVGGKIRGVVNACFPSHAGVLVLDYFNATISAQALKDQGYFFDADSEEWKSIKPDDPKPASLVKGARIEFVSTKIYGSAGTLFLEGDQVAVLKDIK